MDERCIVDMLDNDWLSDEIDDSDADPDFILENSDSETSVENYTDQPTCSQSVAINKNGHIAVWGNVNDATFVNFTYNSSSEEVGTNSDIIETMVGKSPLDYFSLFLDEEMLNI